jgi:Ribosomal protein S10p/S20e
LRRKRSSSSQQTPVTQKAVTQTTRMDVRIRKSPHAYLKLANRFQVRTHVQKLQIHEVHTFVQLILTLLRRALYNTMCMPTMPDGLCAFACFLVCLVLRSCAQWQLLTLVILVSITLLFALYNTGTAALLHRL